MKKNIILFISFVFLGILFVGNSAFACLGGQCSIGGGLCANNGDVYGGKICNNGTIENITVSQTPTTCPSPKCIDNNICYDNGSTIYSKGGTYSCSGGNVIPQYTNPISQCLAPNCKYADGVCASNGSKALYGGNCYSCSNGLINSVPVANCSTGVVSGGGSAPAICTYVSAVTDWSSCVGGFSYAVTGGITYAKNPSLYDSDPACVDVPTSRACTVPPSGLTAVCSPTGTSTLLSWSPITNASYIIKVDKQDTPIDLWKNDCNVSQYEGDICVNPQSDYSGIQWGFGGVKTVSGDFDGDGKSDLAVWNPADGKWYIRPVSGTGIVYGFAHGSSGMIPVPGDYNGDGKSDLAVWNPADGKWYILDATSKNQIVYDYAHGSSSMIPVSGDYNDDRKDDLALWNPTDGKWYILDAISKNQITYGTIIWGSPNMIPVPGDYNGDGKDDLAFWDPATYKWHIRTITGTILTNGTTGISWGFAGNKPVSGDFDGDGKSDLAVWNPADGKWYIRSVSGTTIAWGIQFGASTMIPVPGDYNGDGKSDMALWNQSSNYSWYIKDAPDMQNNFSFLSINNSMYKWWIQSVINGVSSDPVSGPDFACGSICYFPQDKFKLTQTAAPYDQLDGLCKTNYGANWEFATINDTDEDYIMTGNGGNPIFANTVVNYGYAIKNTPSNDAPFQWGDVCIVEKQNSGDWPEPTKMAAFEIKGNLPWPHCYSDVPRTNATLKGICRNTSVASTTPACNTTLRASCSASSNNGFVAPSQVTWVATSTGFTNPSYSWTGTDGLTGNTSSTTISYTTQGLKYATTTVRDGTNTLVVGCPGSAVGGGGGGGGGGIVITSSSNGACSNPLVRDTCAPGSVLSDIADTATEYKWNCNSTTGGTNASCSMNIPVLTPTNCAVSMTNPATSTVNINVNTTWTATPATPCPGCSTVWTLTDSNNSGTPIGNTTNNFLNYIFTTTGLKTIGASISGGAMCTSTTNVVQSGGANREK